MVLAYIPVGTFQVAVDLFDLFVAVVGPVADLVEVDLDVVVDSQVVVVLVVEVQNPVVAEGNLYLVNEVVKLLVEVVLHATMVVFDLVEFLVVGIVEAFVAYVEVVVLVAAVVFEVVVILRG